MIFFNFQGRVAMEWVIKRMRTVPSTEPIEHLAL
jgi:hypothetical protein